MGVAYAIWSGLGIVLVSAVGIVLFRQTLDTAAIVGLGLIILRRRGGKRVLKVGRALKNPACFRGPGSKSCSG